MSDFLAAIRVMTGIMWETNRRLFLGHVFVTIAEVFAALMLALGLRPLINGIYYGRFSDIVAGGLTSVVAALVLVFTPGAQRTFQARSIEDMIKVMECRLLTLASGAPGLEHFERPEYWDRLQVLRRNFGELLQGLFGAFVTPVLAIQLIVTSVVLAQLDPWLVVLPLVTVPVVWLHGRAQRAQQDAEEAVAPARRAVTGLFNLATSAQAASEIRVYGLAPWLLARHEHLAGQVIRRKRKAIARASAIRLSAYVLLAGAYTAAEFIVIRSAVEGRHSPGDVALTLTLAGLLIGAAVVTSEFSSLIARAVSIARNYEKLRVDLSPDAAKTRESAEVPDRCTDGFALEQVSFGYAGSEDGGRFALSGVTTRLPAGSVVAIVGENGAGKTTLVKLLSRMYRPASGRILLDGRDIADFDIESYRRSLSASFQDFVRFELPAKQVVGIGDLDRMRDESALRAALAKARSEFVYQLPSGWDTQLGREWEGGVEISGGQWQKLAIGRSMMRDRALLVVFDEPTAALDPQSEYEIFQQVADEARAGQDNGRVTLLVSHRFSTVRMADLILVLDQGKLIEQGTHSELMASGGLYAELYRLQARAYAS